MLLLIGVAINVGFTWWISLRLAPIGLVAPEAKGHVRGPDREVWIVQVWVRWGATNVLSQRYLAGTPIARQETATPPPTSIEILPAWSSFDEALPAWVAREIPYESRLAKARGWPLRSLCTTTERALSAHSALSSGWRFGNHVLPTRPLWPGFVVNTALYAAAVFALVSPFVICRYRRIRSCRCRKCGYPIGAAAVCTECGRDLARQLG